jgi:hypothetical protein
MANADDTAAAINIARRICDRARLEVGRALESNTLRRALNCRVDATGVDVEAILSVPHYWAIYYHDGRGEIRAKKGKVLVWFASVEDDPRVNTSGYPRRVTDRRKLRLSKAQFKRLRDAGKLIVSTKSGPAQGKPFYRVLRGLGGRVGDIATAEMENLILEGLRKDGSLRVKETIDVPLG